MEKLSVAKRRRLSKCNTEVLCSCIFKGLSSCANNNNTTEVKSSRLDDLQNDLLYEILFRIPAKSLHRCKSVSKRWLSLISSPYFARSYVLNHTSDDDAINMVLFTIQRWEIHSVGQVYALPDLNKLPLGTLPLPLPLFDFIPPLKPDNYDFHDRVCSKGERQGILTGTSLIGVSGGLVLLQATFGIRTDMKPYYLSHLGYQCFYVCNPITHQWIELPLVSKFNLVGFTSYYQQEDSRIWADSTDNIIKHIHNYDPSKIEFTVVSVSSDVQDNVFIISVFSSSHQTYLWTEFRVPFPPGYSSDNSPISSFSKKIVFSNGKFYWCGGNCIVAYDPFNKPLQCHLIPYPYSDIQQTTFLYLEASEGGLRLVTRPAMSPSFSVWELVDYDTKVWTKKFDVVDKQQRRLCFGSFVGGAAGCKAYMENDPSTLLLYDLKNASVLQEYSNPDLINYKNILRCPQPFTSTSWPTRFTQPS